MLETFKDTPEEQYDRDIAITTGLALMSSPSIQTLKWIQRVLRECDTTGTRRVNIAL